MTPRRSVCSRSLVACLLALAITATAAPAAQAVTGYRLTRSFGGTGATTLGTAGRLAVSPNTDDVFVVDRDARKVDRFTKAGEFVNAIDYSAQTDTDNPVVAYDPSSGDVYVGNRDNPVIARYHADGGFVSTVDLSQVGPDGVTRIGGIAVDSTGRLYVSDPSSLPNGTSRNVVQVFSDTGTRITSFDGSNGPSPFTDPGLVAIGASDSVYVTNNYSAVEKFTAQGAAFESILGLPGFANTIAVDSTNDDTFVDGNEGGAGSVSRFTAAGSREARFAEDRGTDIAGIGVDPSTHVVFVARVGRTSAVEVYQPFVAPKVSTDVPTDVTSDGARVTGTVNPQGRPTSYTLVYGTGNYGNPNDSTSVTTDPVDVGSGSADEPVDIPLNGLEPNRIYYAFLRATNDLGSNLGDFRTFTTAAIAPTATGVSAAPISTTATTLNASVNPQNNQGSSTYFEYGTSPGYGSETTERFIAASATTPVDQHASLIDLAPNTTYHFRVVTKNRDGAVRKGEDRTFTTAPQAPATSSSGGSAQFSASVNTGGLAATVAFQVTGTDNAYSAIVGSQDLPAASGSRTVTGAVGGLPAGGSYTVRVRVQSADGTALGDPSAFSTAALAVAPAPAPFSLPPFSLGCAAPRLAQPSKTLTAGKAATLTGSDFGVSGTVTFGSRRAAITRYTASRISLTVPTTASGRVRVTVSCGRASNTVTARVVKPAPSNSFSTSTKVSGSRAKVRVKVPGRGSVSVSGTRVGRKTASPSKAGTVTLKVALTRSGRAALARARGGRLRVAVTVRYRPAGGSVRSARRTLVFRR